MKTRDSENRILRYIVIAILAVPALDIFMLKIFNHDWIGFLEAAVFCAYPAAYGNTVFRCSKWQCDNHQLYITDIFTL